MERKRRDFGFIGGAAAGVALVALLATGWVLGGSGAGAGEATGADGDTEVVESAASDIAAAAQTSPHASSDLDVTSDPEIERLRAELLAEPGRLDLRKRLALQLLRRAQFYAAFEEAGRVLEEAPDDVDGLFVTAAIRVRMGQPSRALPLLERVLGQVPDHVPALTAKGQALLKAGHPQQATAVWKRALELSGGSNAQVEELLRSVPEGTVAPHPVAAQ